MAIKTEPKLSAKLNTLLTEWTAAESAASLATAKEKELRQQIFDLCFPAPVKGSGNQYHLPFDRTLVGDFRTNLSADKEMALAILADKKSNIRPIVEKVIKWKPEVSKAEFSALSDEERNLLGDLITEKPGLPALEIKVTSKLRKKL